MAATTSLQGRPHSLPCHHRFQLPSAHPEILLVRARGDCRSKRAPFCRQGIWTAVSKTGFVPWRSSVRWGGAGSCSEKESVVEDVECEGDEGDAWLVDEATTPFNNITVLELDEAADHELAGAYVLKLDDANLAHSVFWATGRVWSGGCHDVFASLPPLLPDGPIGILGLGAGTVARVLLHVWPSLDLQGWELDPEVVRVGRQYFGLKELESPEKGSRGRLVVHVGDALGPQATVRGGFAGLLVDIFINGAVCKELAQVSTWRRLKKRLRSGGRVMVNCIPNCRHLVDCSEEGVSREWDDLMHRIVRAMDGVFPGEVSVRELTDGNNVMLLSGELPDREAWSSKVPDRLALGVHEWRRWDEYHPLFHWKIANREKQ